METVSDVGEDALIDRLIKLVPTSGGAVWSGPGDDCAVIKKGNAEVLQLLKTDCLVEAVHFVSDTEPERVGWKALCRAISDIGAMAGQPEHCLITLGLPSDFPVKTVEGWYAGAAKAAREFEVIIVGGETSSVPGKHAFISVSLTGEVDPDRVLLRRGSAVGDKIAVTGQLGNSFQSGHHLDFVPRVREAQWLADPANGCRPSAMMDLSDGIAKDLPRLLQSEGHGFRIDEEQLPLREGADVESALCEGEDYELLLTAPSLDLEKWSIAFPDTPLTIIGEVTEEDHPLSCSGGWDHFSKETDG